MEYFAIYIAVSENTMAKSHMAFQPAEDDENAVSFKLFGNPYTAFNAMPNYIDR